MAKQIVHYQKLFRIVSDRIQSGEITGKLPSIAEFTAEFGVSHNTVKKVIDQLKLAGRVYGFQGKGVYVLGPGPKVNNRGVIGICIECAALRNPFYLKVFDALRNELRERDFDFKYFQSAAQVVGDYVDGIIFIDYYLTDLEAQVISDRFGVRLVVVNRKIAPITTVGNDNFSCGYMALEYLHRQGHRKIGLISRDTHIKKSIFDYRMQGVMKYVGEHPEIEIADSPIHITRGGADEIFASRAARELLDARKDLTAIFAFTDVLALGVLSELQQRGIRVPDDISLCGVDNRDFSVLMNPPLTTLEEPAELVAHQAMEMLLRQIDEGRWLDDLLLPPVMVERASVKQNS